MRSTRTSPGTTTAYESLAKAGSSDFQTSFEYLTVFMVAENFSDVLSSMGAKIIGDNLGALNDALSLNSTSPGMSSVAREIA